jgi:hypothetical protein
MWFHLSGLLVRKPPRARPARRSHARPWLEVGSLVFVALQLWGVLPKMWPLTGKF